MAGSALLLSEMHTRILALLIPLSLALRFEIAASHGEGTLKCFSQFFTKGAHVFGHVDVPAQDAQRIDIEVDFSNQGQRLGGDCEYPVEQGRRRQRLRLFIHDPRRVQCAFLLHSGPGQGHEAVGQDEAAGVY